MGESAITERYMPYTETDNWSRIHERRRSIWLIILTAIVLGLTLNLIADMLWNLSPNPYWRIGLIAASSLLTVAVVHQAIVLMYEGISTITEDFNVRVVWNLQSGEFPSIPYLITYSPQETLHSQIQKLSQNEFENLRKKIPSYNSPYPWGDGFMREIFVHLILTRIHWFPGQHGILPGRITLSDMKGDDYLPILPPIYNQDTLAILPGSVRAEYRRTQIGGQFALEWKENCSGKLTFAFTGRCKRADQRFTTPSLPSYPNLLGLPTSESIDSRDLGRIEINCRITAEFSPIDLFFTRKNAPKLFA
jgi:hypothetical protein